MARRGGGVGTPEGGSQNSDEEARKRESEEVSGASVSETGRQLETWMGKSGIETASRDSRWTKKRGFARILARYEVCMPSRRPLSIVLRSARDVTLRLAVLIRAPSKTCLRLYRRYTIVARATVARCSSFFSLSLCFPLVFTHRSQWYDFQGGRKYYVCFVPSRVMSAVCRILEPFPSVGISTKWSKESDTEEGDIFGCYARTYLCIILINSIRGVWFRLLSY